MAFSGFASGKPRKWRKACLSITRGSKNPKNEWFKGLGLGVRGVYGDGGEVSKNGCPFWGHNIFGGCLAGVYVGS